MGVSPFYTPAGNVMSELGKATALLVKGKKLEGENFRKLVLRTLN